MSGSNPDKPSASCACGQVVFDVAGRKAGDILFCPWCQRRFRYLESGVLAPLDEAEEVEEEKRSQVVAEAKGGSLAERMKAHTARHKREQADAQAPKSGQGGDSPKNRAKVRRREVPGGALRMIAFIVVSNALALILLQVFFVRQHDGSRATPWGTIIPRHRIPWPELAALLAGHLCGFVAWACWVYWLQKAQRIKAAGQAPLVEKKDATKNES